MFFGEYEHSLDAKGRLILPSKFRDRFEGGGFVTKVLDGCLAIYPAEEFSKVAAELHDKARRGATERTVMRTFAAGTAEVEPDRQGRIAIPSHLRAFAALEPGGSAVVTGAINRLEVWDAGRWAEVNRQGEELLAAAQPGLEDLGV